VLLAAAFEIGLYWHLPILIVLVSLVYSATRYDQWGAILHESIRWGLRLAGFLVGIGILLYLFTVLTTVQFVVAAIIEAAVFFGLSVLASKA
jgi:hypothetical protein